MNMHELFKIMNCMLNVLFLNFLKDRHRGQTSSLSDHILSIPVDTNPDPSPRTRLPSCSPQSKLCSQRPDQEAPSAQPQPTASKCPLLFISAAAPILAGPLGAGSPAGCTRAALSSTSWCSGHRLSPPALPIDTQEPILLMSFV